LARGDLQVFRRFAGGIRRYLKHPLTLEECRRIVAEAESRRDDNFLALLRRAVYANSRSPYRRLLEHVRIEYGDIEKDVRSNGIEAAMRRLYTAGVYLGFDEFKGNQRIERPGLSLEVKAEDFDNPLLKRDFEVESSGSTGARRRMAVDLDALVYDAAVRRSFYEGAGVLDRPHALWRAAPPGSAGIKHALRGAKLGRPVERWFSPTVSKWTSGMWPSALLTSITVGMGQLAGGVIPRPEHVPLTEPQTVARWVASKSAAGTPALLSLPAANGVRVARAAKEEGLSLEGAVFELGGEAITEAKLREIEDCGARSINCYSLSETGQLGVGCLQRSAIDEVHLISGKVAVNQHAVSVQDGTAVEALFFTTLHPTTPKLMLNVDIGDYGVMPSGNCGCAMEKLGYRRRLHTIRSYEKLTAGGMHFIGSNVVAMLEEVLPSRHGGAPGDYQLVEEERNGLSTVNIVVSPRVALRDGDQLTRTILDSLSSDSRGARMMADQWRQTVVLEVIRREPYTTAAGKTPPIRVVPR
jgi:hypothetical protein